MIVNIAGYKFTPLDELATLRTRLQQVAKAARLKGTVLLSTEGINLFLAGQRAGIDAFLADVRQVGGLEDFTVKESLSDEQPFNRMLVKIKREIISFGVPGIEPARYTAPRITPAELKRWLDEKRPITLLDTRNNYEVAAGTFRGAVVADIDDFREFPNSVVRLPAELRDTPIVTFCTGGIRCEKAAPYLETQGFREVYQLDGGILKYFEECGAAHFEGQCFVFDRRVALDPQLAEGGLAQCFACQAILTAEDQRSPYYVEGESCPHCYRSESESLEALLAKRQAALRSVTSPLPGCVAYDNRRPISVPARFDGLKALDFFEAMRTHLDRDAWRAACAEGRVTHQGVAVAPEQIVRAGQRLIHLERATTEPVVASDIQIVHEDDALVVVAKPAPLPMHPCGRFHRNTLSYILEQVYRPLRLRPAHRLDADTSGVVVFSKRGTVARLVQPQFERGEVNKEYLARIHGRLPAAECECDVGIVASAEHRGIRVSSREGASAKTLFRELEVFGDGSSLVAAQPITGRTNQIRVHLWELGAPIVGDPIYLPERRLGAPGGLSVAEGPLCLHAAGLELTHPLTGLRVRYEAASPGWATG